MGKVWRSNSNLGSHPFLESVLLTCGASKILWKHAQAIMHQWLSFYDPFSLVWALSCSRKGVELSPSQFCIFPMFLHGWGSRFWNAKCICRRDSPFSVCWGLFLSPSLFGSFSSFFHAQKLFFCVAGRMGRNGPRCRDYGGHFTSVSKLGASLMFFDIFLAFSKLENPFSCCCVNGLRRFTIYGFGEVIFAPVVVVDVFLNSNLKSKG